MRDAVAQVTEIPRLKAKIVPVTEERDILKKATVESIYGAMLNQRKGSVDGRKVLSWRLSNSMDVSFYLEGLEEVFICHGQPEIFNTDQGSQFTSFDFTSALKDRGIKISMDGKILEPG